MKTFQHGSRILALVVSSLACDSLAQGQTIDWVGSAGSDDISCGNRLSPCRTLQIAMSPPRSGDVIKVADPGEYGQLNIGRAVTIDGGGLITVVQFLGNPAIQVNAGASDVVIIRNLSIVCATRYGCAGNGIQFNSGKALRVENVSISGFSGSGGIGINVNTGAFAVLTVENTTITDSDSGINITTNVIVAAELDHVRIWGCDTGVSAGNGARITLRNSEVSMNSRAGVFLFNSLQGSEVDIDSTTLNYNGVGVWNFVGGTVARITNNVIMNNGTGLLNQGGQIISAGDNTVVGNFTDGFPTSTLTKR